MARCHQPFSVDIAALQRAVDEQFRSDEAEQKHLKAEVNCDLRRWGLKLDERGGKNGKKRAVIATARKLAVLQHRLWVSGEAYEPLRHCREMLPAAA